MLFWIVALALSLLSLGWIVRPLLRRGNDGVVRSSYDIQVYKDQLKEVERDLARGVLNEVDATASRTEISRRLLAAADTSDSETVTHSAPRSVSAGLVAAVAALFIGGAALYSQMGAPGYPDMPLGERVAARPSQVDAEAIIAATQTAAPAVDPQHLALVQQLADALATRPDDLTGHQMLADNLAQLGRYGDARIAQDKVIAILGDQATAEDYASQAEIMIIAVDGYISPQAETALANAMQLDPQNPRARFYVGLALWRRGQPEQTYQIWAALQAEGHNQPWMNVIDAELANVAAEAGITRGPSAADIDAAADMTDSDRTDMIRGMVISLSDRLATQGGTPDEWAQLIRALGVLGDTEQAAAIWADSQSVFANQPDAIATIRAAAQDAGVAQ